MIYLDNNASTQVAPEVFEAMRPFLTGEYGNPSSAHAAGRRSKFAIAEARASVAGLVGAASPGEIYFTATGSESDNWAIRGSLRFDSNNAHVITTRIEHGAVRLVFDALERRGCRVTRLDVDEDGAIDLAGLKAALSEQTRLVSVMYANNETGIISQVGEIGAIIKERSDALFHVDGVTATGKIPIDLKATAIDLFSLAGHKFYAPKGVGALYVREGVKLTPWVVGGDQERGLRSGTEAVHQIVGLGAAARLVSDMSSMERIRHLRDRLEYEILNKIPNSHLNGTADVSKRLPNTSSISFAGVNGEMLMARLDDAGICVSTGSACHSQAGAASGVLGVMNIPYERAMGAIRFSLGRYNTEAEIGLVMAELPGIVAGLKRIAA